MNHIPHTLKTDFAAVGEFVTFLMLLVLESEAESECLLWILENQSESGERMVLLFVVGVSSFPLIRASQPTTISAK